MKKFLMRLYEEDDGIGTVEIILILVGPDWTCHYFQKSADQSGQ